MSDHAMMFFATLTVVALTFVTTPAMAQQHQPYAGLESRPVKTLSDEQIADLRAGRGMGLALAAELNGYPGPLHVLEFAHELQLTEAQRAEVKRLFDAMKSETVTIGERLIDQETDLDRAFAGRTITPSRLVAATEAISATQAALRAAHLKYHLHMMDVLTPAQIQSYGKLRGYSAAPRPDGHDGHRPRAH